MIDWTVSINTPIIVGVVTICFGLLQKGIRKNRRSHELTDIKVESIIHAVFFSLNGAGQEAQQEYQKKKAELMKEKNFIDES